MRANVLRLHPDDNVVTAILELEPGQRLQADAPLPTIDVKQPIPFGHKIAIRPVAKGEHIIKYGASIGVATADIAVGEHVHIHNLASVRGDATR
ncbi:MAG: UxaA family hydrolase [Anaerolineae bacterium]